MTEAELLEGLRAALAESRDAMHAQDDERAAEAGLKAAALAERAAALRLAPEGQTADAARALLAELEALVTQRKAQLAASIGDLGVSARAQSAYGRRP